MRIFFITGAFCFILLFSIQASATDWYIDGLHGNDDHSGAKNEPLRNTWRGVQFARPGDTIHLLPTTVYGDIGIGKSGTPSAFITLKGEGVAPNLTKIKTDGTNFGIQVNSGASYINITNFDVEATGPWYGIYIGDKSHHVTVTNNNVHDSGNGGIGATRADYITVKNNTVRGSCRNTTNGVYGSGISFYQSTDIDSNTGVKMVVDGNTVYGNTNTPSGSPLDADGSGIILDDLRHGQGDKIPYRGRTLVQNNIVAGNGGRGVSIYNSDHATVMSNTVFHNNQDPHEASWRPGEVMIENGGGDIDIVDNILYSDGASGTSATGAHVALSVGHADDGVGPVNADFNLLYNSKNEGGLSFYAGTDPGHGNSNSVTFDSHNMFGNPLFVAPNVDAANANFHLQPDSPALAAGLPNIGAVVSQSTGLKVIATVSGDFYLVDPIVGLVVDGRLRSQANVTASHARGQWQTVTFTVANPGNMNNFGLRFLDDAFDGKNKDRNLYVKEVTANGKGIPLDLGTYITASGKRMPGQEFFYTTGTLTWTAALLPK
jgi:parallel beta-helix repeat protein